MLCDDETCAGCSAQSGDIFEGCNSTNGSLFVAVSSEAGHTFEEARAFCRAKYVDLASVHSVDELHMAAQVCGHLSDSVQGNHSMTCFIGLHTKADGGWDWSDGTSTDLEEAGFLTSLQGRDPWAGLGQQDLGDQPIGWRFQNVSDLATAFICEDRFRTGLQLVGDARVTLPPMTLGGLTLAVSSWVQLGPSHPTQSFLADVQQGSYAGLALFSSYQSSACGSSIQCKNAVGETLDSRGWLAIGTESGRDLSVSGVVFDSTMTVDDFFSVALGDWALFSFSFIERAVHVYVNGVAVGTGTLEADVPRMLRRENSIGGLLGAGTKRPDSLLQVADFRVYDRSITPLEAAALHDDPSAECCVSAGLIDTFRVGSVDLTAEVMAAVVHPSAVTARPQASASNDTAAIDPGVTPCSLSEAATIREVDICGGETTAIEDCHGIVRSGMGP